MHISKERPYYWTFLVSTSAGGSLHQRGLSGASRAAGTEAADESRSATEANAAWIVVRVREAAASTRQPSLGSQLQVHVRIGLWHVLLLAHWVGRSANITKYCFVLWFTNSGRVINCDFVECFSYGTAAFLGVLFFAWMFYVLIKAICEPWTNRDNIEVSRRLSQSWNVQWNVANRTLWAGTFPRRKVTNIFFSIDCMYFTMIFFFFK